MSFEHWINERISVTDEDIKSYFYGAKKYRGIYFLEMKKQIASKMAKDGYKQREICSILRTSRSMISVYKNHSKPLNPDSVKSVIENKYSWIKEGLYPKSKNILTYPDSVQTCNTIFELVKYHQL